MSYRYLLYFIFSIIFFSLSAQKQTNIWYFGQNAGLNFNSGAPVALTNGQLSTSEGCATICDANGNLLFYTDGIKVWNRNHNVMTNGNGLAGDPSSTQSAIIVPKPGSTSTYYIFTVDLQGGELGPPYRGFRYSEVDMTASAGLGAVVAGQKNILLKTPTTEGITAVKHANGTDFWVIAHGWKNNTYFAFRVTAAGVNTTAVQSNTGPSVIDNGSSGNGAIGYTKASPDGSKIAACHSYGNNQVVLSDFSTATGVVSNSQAINLKLNANSDGPYGVEFSNCNEYLYVTEMFSTYGSYQYPQSTIIWRFDLNAPSIPASKTNFATIPNEWVGGLQLAADGNIYCASVIRYYDIGIGDYYGIANTYIHRINNPRLPGATFSLNATYLAGRTVLFGLPPFITSYFNNSDFTAVSSIASDTIFCAGETAIFTSQLSTYDSIRWYFGDPSSGINNTSILPNPSHLYANAGIYTATLYKYLCSKIDSVKKTINVRILPVFNIRDTAACTGNPITLNPGIAGASYNWSSGQTTQTATYNTGGSFSLTVTLNQCSYTDNFNIAFSPIPIATITPSGPTTFCSPGSVVLSAPAAMTSYQWYLGGAPIVGQAGQTLTVTASGSYSVRVEKTGCFNTSAATVVTVNAGPTLNITPIGPVNICSGNSTTLTLTTPGLSNIKWYQNAGLLSGQTATTLSVNSAGTYYVTGDAAGCTGTSNYVVVDIDPSLPVSVSISPSANPICTGTSVTFTATPTNGGGAPVYQWLLNGTPVGSNSPTYTNAALANSDQVQVRLTSNATCPTGSPALSNIVNMSISSAVPVSVSVSPSANPVCAGTSVTFTATPVNGGITPAYQWYLNAAPVGSNSPTYNNAALANGDQVSVRLTSSDGCATGSPATSNTVVMAINPTSPVSVSIAPSANPICVGTSVTFTATPVNGGATPAYQWLLNGAPVGSNIATYTNASLSNGDQVAVRLTTSISCSSGSPALSNAVVMTVNPNLPVSVSVAPSANPVCAGTSVTFSATPVNGGAAPVYQWSLNGAPVGSNSVTYTNAALSNGDKVNVSLTSNATCPTGNPATSNTVVMSVNPNLPVSVAIAPDQNPICTGTSVTFTATPVNGGASPVYQWSLNGAPVGSNSASYTNAALANGDQVAVRLTSNATCPTGNPATSNTVVMSVGAPVPVSVSVAPSANPICAGTSVTFTATPVNGGATPVYQWLLNGAPVGSNAATYTNTALSNGDQVDVRLTTSISCSSGSPALSNAVVMTVNPNLPVSVSVAPSANPVCAGTSVTFSATPVNGGAAPVYQWSLNGAPVGSNSVTYTNAALSNGDKVNVSLTSNATCPTGNPATSNTVVMSVNPNLPVSVAIAPDQNPICIGTSVTFTATPVNGGASPVYQWSLNGAPVGSNSATYTNTTLANGDQVRVSLISNATCPSGNPASSNVINMTVNAYPLVDIGSDQTICEGQTASFDAGNPGATFSWNSGQSAAQISVPDPGKYVVTVTRNNCSTKDSALVIVDPAFTVDLGPDQALCAGAQALLSTGITDGTSYAWSTGETSPTIVANTNGTYDITVIRGACSSSDQLTLTFDLIAPSPISIGPDTILCEDDAILLDAGNEPGASYLWQDGSSGSTLSVSEAGLYFISVTNQCGTVTDSIEVFFENCECNVFVPSAFTPNIDGNNDLFAPIITCDAVTEYRFSIFNRWNEMIFTTDQVDTGWDGVYKGQPQALDIYIYFVSYFDQRINKTILQRGIVNLLR